MKTIKTEILINSTPGKIWELLTDFDGYPEWNPFIKSIQGSLSEGSKLEVKIAPPNEKAMIFKPSVLKVTQEREFRWLGNLGVKGLFDGEHYFVLEQVKDNEVRFIHGENFKGILVGLFGGMLKKTEHGFRLMNDALKGECEKTN